MNENLMKVEENLTKELEDLRKGFGEEFLKPCFDKLIEKVEFHEEYFIIGKINYLQLSNIQPKNWDVE